MYLASNWKNLIETCLFMLKVHAFCDPMPMLSYNIYKLYLSCVKQSEINILKSLIDKNMY